MFAQLLETFRKASESSFQTGQDVLKSWVQQGVSTANIKGTPAEWSGEAQKRWSEFTMEALTKQQKLLDATYKASSQVLEQTFKVGDAKSLEEHRQRVEGLWRQVSDSLKSQYAAQALEFQQAMTRWFDVARQNAGAQGATGAQPGTGK
jgi:hypothetical protein